jgi:dihydrolipoamide dehydrogenase
VGDVANSRMTANQATADASVAIANIMTPGSRKQDRASVPDTLYSAIELARVGHADAQTTPAGNASFDANPRALAQGDDSGFVHLFTDARSGTLNGAEIAGAQASELIHLAAQALGQPDALKQLVEASYTHPARAEDLLRAAAPHALFMPPAERLVVAK